MPVFSNEIPLTEDFKAYVKESSENGDWADFLDYFGSHFASRVIFGGRYTYQHLYSAQSMSFFTSMNLDVKIASKVQFFQLFKLQMSEELKMYINQTAIINTKVESTQSFMTGG